MAATGGRPLDDDAVQCLERRLHVVRVGPSDHSGERRPPPVGEDVPLRAELAPVGGVGTSLFPPRGALTELESSDCHFHSVLRSSSYLPRSFAQSSLKTPSFTHRWNLRWTVDTEPYSLGRDFHWHPVPRTWSTPSMAFLNGTGGLPLVPGFFSSPSRGAISAQRSSGIRLIVGSFFFIAEPLRDHPIVADVRLPRPSGVFLG